MDGWSECRVPDAKCNTPAEVNVCPACAVPLLTFKQDRTEPSRTLAMLTPSSDMLLHAPQPPSKTSTLTFMFVHQQPVRWCKARPYGVSPLNSIFGRRIRTCTGEHLVTVTSTVLVTATIVHSVAEATILAASLSRILTPFVRDQTPALSWRDTVLVFSWATLTMQYRKSHMTDVSAAQKFVLTVTIYRQMCTTSTLVF